MLCPSEISRRSPFGCGQFLVSRKSRADNWSYCAHFPNFAMCILLLEGTSLRRIHYLMLQPCSLSDCFEPLNCLSICVYWSADPAVGGWPRFREYDEWLVGRWCGTSGSQPLADGIRAWRWASTSHCSQEETCSLTHPILHSLAHQASHVFQRPEASTLTGCSSPASTFYRGCNGEYHCQLERT